MDIYFRKTTYNSYGGTFKEPFRYFGRILSDRFKLENIQFSFDEIEIYLAIFSNKPKGNSKEKYQEWYSNLPVYYRGKKMVRVTLPLLENEKCLEDVFIITLNAFEILNAKKKKADLFDYEKITEVLHSLQAEFESIDLLELHKKYELILYNEALSNRIAERATRENRQIENKRLIRDLRFYYDFEGSGNLYFAPYDNRICDRILEKLRKNKFRLPDYSHLYIRVSNTHENALYHSLRAESWFVYGIVVFENYLNYEKESEKEKQIIVFNLIKQGLYDIAKIDKLDLVTLNNVLDEVEKEIKI